MEKKVITVCVRLVVKSREVSLALFSTEFMDKGEGVFWNWMIDVSRVTVSPRRG